MALFDLEQHGAVFRRMAPGHTQPTNHGPQPPKVTAPEELPALEIVFDGEELHHGPH